MVSTKGLRSVLNEIILDPFAGSYEIALGYYFGYINSLKNNNLITKSTYNRLFRIYNSLYFSSRIVSFRGL